VASNANNVLIQAAGVRDDAQNLRDTLADIVQRLAGQGTTGDAAAQLTAQLEQLKSVSQVQAGVVSENTQAVSQNTVARETSGGSALQTAGNVVTKIFKSGLGLSPLISGLVGLFGGGGSEAPPPLPVYSQPPAVNFEGVFSRSAGTGITERGAEQPPAQAAPQITIAVQAMDSRSFLDHREEIARAVREAMLNSNSLNDVVNDL
jgi:hypothetical protein